MIVNPIPTKIVFAILPFGSVIGDYFKFIEPKSDRKDNYILELFNALEEFVLKDLFIKDIKEFQGDYFNIFSKTFINFRYVDPNTVLRKKIFLRLEIAVRCLNSSFLNVRVKGIKEIENQCTSVCRTTINKGRIDELSEWISNNKILLSIFGIDHHSELIDRSEYILKVISRSVIGINKEECETIWNLTMRDKQTKKEIYQKLGKIGDLLDKNFVEFIFERIKELDYLSSTDLAFIYSFKKNTEFQVECTWKILNDSGSYPEDVVKTAFEKLVETIKVTTMVKKLAIMYQCNEMIKSHTNSLIFIKILYNTVKSLNLSTAKIQNIADDFETAKGEILKSFFEDFEYYCNMVKEKCAEDQRKIYTAAEEYFVDKFTHQENLTERFAFITEIYTLI